MTKNWQKNLKKYLAAGENCGKSVISVVPEAIPLLLLRELEHSDSTLAVTLPDAKTVEKVHLALEELMARCGITKKILLIPECGRGKLLFPGGRGR